MINNIIYSDETEHSMEGYNWIIVVPIMQIFAALATEFLNVFFIFQKTTAPEIITNYVAFGVVAEVDDIFAFAIKRKKFKEEMEEYKFKVRSDEVNENGEDGGLGLMKVLYKLLKFFF